MKKLFKRYKRQIFALLLVFMISCATCISISADDIYDDYQSVIITLDSSMTYGDSDSTTRVYSYAVGNSAPTNHNYFDASSNGPITTYWEIESEDFSFINTYGNITYSYDDSSHISYNDAIGIVNIGGFYISLYDSYVPINASIVYGGYDTYGDITIDISYRTLGDFEEKHFQVSADSTGDFVLEMLIEEDLGVNYDIQPEFAYVSSVVINYHLPHEVENVYYALDDEVNFSYDIVFTNLPTQSEMIERDAQSFLLNHSQDKTVLDSVLDLFSTVGTWIANSVQNLISMFYAEGDLTFLGVLSVAGLSISVLFMLLSFLLNFLRFRG